MQTFLMMIVTIVAIVATASAVPENIRYKKAATKKRAPPRHRDDDTDPAPRHLDSPYIGGWSPGIFATSDVKKYRQSFQMGSNNNNGDGSSAVAGGAAGIRQAIGES